mmetsp:Transcript_2715/g.4086  ORF Transcript_2715/g.4086 Transcript_2715/m.4086 type:complete len:101 (-) Transcript_2715:138-440(-)
MPSLKKMLSKRKSDKMPTEAAIDVPEVVPEVPDVPDADELKAEAEAKAEAAAEEVKERAEDAAGDMGGNMKWKLFMLGLQQKLGCCFGAPEAPKVSGIIG